MERIIPRGLIKHLEWYPSTPDLVTPTPNTATHAPSIDDLINRGRTFDGRKLYQKNFPDDHTDSIQEDRMRRVYAKVYALQEAYDELGKDGVIATIPYLIAGKAKADEHKNYLWQHREVWNALTEENSGIDREGKLLRAGEPVVVIVHGGGILTLERIVRAYEGGLTESGHAGYTIKEFADLLNGKLPSGESIDLYHVDDVKQKKIPDPFGRYAVWIPGNNLIGRSGVYNSQQDFMENELVAARAGTLEYLEEYLEKSKSGKMESYFQLDNKPFAIDRNGYLDSPNKYPHREVFGEPQGFMNFLANDFKPRGPYPVNKHDLRYTGAIERLDDSFSPCFAGVGPSEAAGYIQK